jgi:hypothetical protein
MSRKVTKDNMRHKDRYTDLGLLPADDPIYSEGWSIGVPLNASNFSQLIKPRPSKAKATAKH